jgi:AcrR family transcriptional regulator
MICMSTREVILDAVRRLVSQRHVLPSLDAVAAEAGVSKGGLIHHFPSRAALLEAVVGRELDRVDVAMIEAADRGSAARTWLELALPDTELIEVYRAMDIVLKALSSGSSTLPEVVAVRVAHWDDLLAAELGDANQALVVRLVGDGLLLNAVSGTPPAPERVAALIDHLVPKPV